MMLVVVDYTFNADALGPYVQGLDQTEVETSNDVEQALSEGEKQLDDLTP